MPRLPGDYLNNDEIYQDINNQEKEMAETLPVDAIRASRTLDEMAQEAAQLRSLFTPFEDIWS